MKGIYRDVFLVLLLALIPALGFAGGQKSGSTAAAPAGSLRPDVDGPLVPYKAPLEVWVPATTSPSIVFVNNENAVDNFVSRLFTKHLNIVEKGKWVVDESQAKEKLNAAVASNDLPDIFVADYEVLGRLLKADQIQELGGVYSEYATDKFKGIAEYDDKRGFIAATKDGKIYGLPVMGSMGGSVVLVWIRKDWLDNLHLQIPNTVDDLLNIARAFRDQDPDGNGKNDTIPFALTKNLSGNINVFANPVGAYYDIWIPDNNGGIKYGSVQPEMKTALGIMQAAYKEGLFDKEFGVKDGNIVDQETASGTVGIYPGYFWSPLNPLRITRQNVEGADWVCVPMPAGSNGKRVWQTKIPTSSVLVVRKGFEYPEAAIKIMNMYAELFDGIYTAELMSYINSETYWDFQPNWHTISLPGGYEHPMKNPVMADNIKKVDETGDKSYLTTDEQRRNYDKYKTIPAEGWDITKIFLEGYTVVRSADGYVYDEYLCGPTPTMLTRWANLKKLQDETFISIIMGEPLSNFDKFVADWKAQGGDQITRELSDWYKSAH